MKSEENFPKLCSDEFRQHEFVVGGIQHNFVTFFHMLTIQKLKRNYRGQKNQGAVEFQDISKGTFLIAFLNGVDFTGKETKEGCTEIKEGWDQGTRGFIEVQCVRGIQEIEYEMVGKGTALEGQIIGFHIC